MDDYVIGSMILYIDIIGLFIQILRLLNSKWRRNEKIIDKTYVCEIYVIFEL